jgi:hypothetical protein
MLVWELGYLWHPVGDGTFELGVPYTTLQSAKEGRVSDPLSNRQTAEVKFSTAEIDAQQSLNSYKNRLRCWLKLPDDSVYLVFSGIITESEVDTETHEIAVKAADDSIRLESHFIRLGDRVLNDSSHPTLPNPYDGKIPVTSEGLRWLIDCARNLDGNQEDNYPPLGISAPLSADDYDWANPLRVSFQRGDQVWQSILDFVSVQTAPEFKLIPMDESAEGSYCRLYTAPVVGLHDPVNNVWLPDETTATNYLNLGWLSGEQPIISARFEAGYGLNNCSMKHRNGGKLVSHVHALAEGASEEERHRVTVHDAVTGEEYGVYVHWEQTTFKSSNEDALREKGEQILTTYRQPQNFIEVKLHGEADIEYMRDFLTGARVRAAYREREMRGEFTCRIMETRLVQDPKSQYGHRTEVTLIPTITGAIVDEET